MKTLLTTLFLIGSINLTVYSQTKLLKVHEFSIRSKATTSFKPEYPAAAKKAKAAGVVVAQIFADGDGNVSDVKVLEAPHSSIEEAVKRALFKWKIKPYTIKGEAVRVTAKLTFYYVIDKNGSRVENPKPF